MTSVSVTPFLTSSVTPTPTPTVSPTKSIAPTPSLTPSPTPTATPQPQQISNTSFANFATYDLDEILFITSNGGSNVPPYNKQGNEYVNNTILNKALMKLMINNQTLASYLNYRFTGNLTPQTNNITSGDILPMTKAEKQTINIGYDNNSFVNVNEKTAPQVLTRVFENLYNVGAAIANLTNIKITNFNQLIQNLDVAIPLMTPTSTPSLTPSSTATPSVTPTHSITSTPSTTPSVTPSLTPSNTPSHTPSVTPSASLLTCVTWQFFANNGVSGQVTYTVCGGSSSTQTVTDSAVICVASGNTPTSSTGYLVNLGSLCNGVYP